MAREQMTDEERQAYREAKRTEAEDRLDELLTAEGWATWLKLRARLHSFSWTNQVLIAVQAHGQHEAAEAKDKRAPEHPCSPMPTIVKAAWRWKLDGYHPAKGTRGLFVWTPHNRGKRDATFWTCCGQTIKKGKGCPSCGKTSTYFLLKAVFDASQVVSFDTGTPPEIELPQGSPILGDDPGRELLWPLADWALGCELVGSIDMDAVSDHGELGSFNQRSRHLKVVGTGPANGRLRVLIHELAHAKGISSRNDALKLTYDDAEVAVECVSYMVASTVGLDTSSEAIPYIAGWGGAEAKTKVRQLAELIDRTAKELEEPILELLANREEVTA